ncbi:MAG: fructose-bisphosphate aldolase [Spirochaetales bacterium]|nr:fructose-bisphosphate aldolase [Spirochaetales bacterium]
MRRLGNIFRDDKKTVIVAMDHGLGLDVLPAMKDTSGIITSIVRGGADAVLTGYGMGRNFTEELKGTGLILRVDGGNSILSSFQTGNRILDAEDALIEGADCLACMGFPGAVNEVDTLINVSELAAEAHAWGLPVLAEMLPGGFSSEPPKTVENIRLAARIGAELGADIIKTSFVGSVSEFRTVVDGCFKPVIVLGGAKVKNLQDLFELVEKAMEAGARGVAIGRNIWQHSDPGAVTAALVEIVHDERSASEVGRNL